MIPGETDKHREIVAEYVKGNTLDIGSSGCSVCEHAIQLDLPRDKWKIYNTTRSEYPIHWRGDAMNLPFKDGVLDAVHSSHLLEDYENWQPPLNEWSRVLARGGYMIISIPDHKRFRYRVEHMGQGDNLSHRHMGRVGELSDYLRPMGYEMIMDRFVNDTDATEYSIIAVGRKL